MSSEGSKPIRIGLLGRGTVGAADQLDDQVGALDDLAEIALAAGQRAGQLRTPPGGRLDRVGAFGEQTGKGRADGAMAKQANADRFRHR